MKAKDLEAGDRFMGLLCDHEGDLQDGPYSILMRTYCSWADEGE